MSDPKLPALIAFVALLAAAPFAASTAADWLQWRVPSGQNQVEARQDPLLKWSDDSNIRWRSRIPGRGFSSPIVIGDLIVLTTAVEEEGSQWVLALNGADGAIRWKERIHNVGPLPRMHRKNSGATPTPASDGQRIYVVFHNTQGLYLSSLSLDGAVEWQKRIGDYRGEYQFGYAPSPTIFEETVIIASEYAEGGFLAAFDLSNGSKVWETPRSDTTSYSSPIVTDLGGRDQIILSGDDEIAAYDPRSGERLWHVEGSSRATCGTVVWSEEIVFASGGFPNKETIAVRSDGESGEVVWKNGDKSYEQSMIYHEGFLYTFNDNGIMICWDAETGEEKWKERLGGPVSASPLLIGDLIYATNERGITFVVRADPMKFEQLSENPLGDEGFASIVPYGSSLLIRSAEVGVDRQEWLYCIGN
ncbi:MAG: PQQ-binding-like beta-propeller repeat protein [Verrucomicrobiota bacterium]